MFTVYADGKAVASFSDPAKLAKFVESRKFKRRSRTARIKIVSGSGTTVKPTHVQ
jgi:hypothetical protein